MPVIPRLPSLRPPIAYKYLGSSIPYLRGLELQELLVTRRAASEAPTAHVNVLLLLQHPPTYTAGRRVRGTEDTEGARLRGLGAEYYEVKRGGQTTYHGPGQLVGYPIFDLRHYEIGVRSYIEHLERTLIDTCSQFNVTAQTTSDTGVWVEDRKIAALGIHVRRHITNHGFALNCDVDLSWFEHIVACGLPDKKATSLSAESKRIAAPFLNITLYQLNRPSSAPSKSTISVDDAIPATLSAFERVFGAPVDLLKNVSPELDSDIDEWIRKE
ncbi:putative lipoyltransferase 2, mitochondrial [Rhizophlyctis rosea]|nr:putative lipoyltransferase 2, mitochondrial [Rhizophlyctis rosea]